MATPQSNPDTDNRQPKRWRKYVAMTFRVIGVLILAVLIIEIVRESTNYIRSGALFGIALAYVSFCIARKHKILASPAALVLTWRIFGLVSILATVLLYAHNDLWDWLRWTHWLVMLPMIVFTGFALVAGIYFATKLRKDPDAVFTSELYLVAATLGFVVLTKLGTWYGVNVFQNLMRYEESAYILLAIAGCLLVRTNAKRPDMIYTDETPSPAPNTEAHNTDDLDNDFPTSPITQLDPDGYPIDPARRDDDLGTPIGNSPPVVR